MFRWLGLAFMVGVLVWRAGNLWRMPTAERVDAAWQIPSTFAAFAVVPLFAGMLLLLCDNLAGELIPGAVYDALDAIVTPKVSEFSVVTLGIGLLMIVGMLFLVLEQLVRANLIEVLVIVLACVVPFRADPRAKPIYDATIRLFVGLAVLPVAMGVCMRVTAGDWPSVILDDGKFNVIAGLKVAVGMIIPVMMPSVIFRLFPVGDSHGGEGRMGAAAMAAGVAAGGLVASALRFGSGGAGTPTSGGGAAARSSSDRMIGEQGGGSSSGAAGSGETTSSSRMDSTTSGESRQDSRTGEGPPGRLPEGGPSMDRPESGAPSDPDPPSGGLADRTNRRAGSNAPLGGQSSEQTQLSQRRVASSGGTTAEPGLDQGTAVGGSDERE